MAVISQSISNCATSRDLVTACIGNGRAISSVKAELKMDGSRDSALD